MTEILNFALKTKGVVGSVTHAKYSDPATPPKKNKQNWNVHLFDMSFFEPNRQHDGPHHTPDNPSGAI